MIRKTLLAFSLCLSVAACQQEAAIAPPEPVAMTEEAVGHYCQMNVIEHDGPKAQIHVVGLAHPLWFSQVRDAVAFTRLPEETAEVRAIFVNDMGKAASWNEPGENNWIDSKDAVFVINSAQTGGMGAPEAIPFGDRKIAEAFILEHGGMVVAFDAIPDAYVLAPVQLPEQSPDHHDGGGHDKAHTGAIQ